MYNMNPVQFTFKRQVREALEEIDRFILATHGLQNKKVLIENKTFDMLHSNLIASIVKKREFKNEIPYQGRLLCRRLPIK